MRASFIHLVYHTYFGPSRIVNTPFGVYRGAGQKGQRRMTPLVQLQRQVLLEFLQNCCAWPPVAR